MKFLAKCAGREMGEEMECSDYQMTQIGDSGVIVFFDVYLEDQERVPGMKMIVPIDRVDFLIIAPDPEEVEKCS